MFGKNIFYCLTFFVLYSFVSPEAHEYNNAEEGEITHEMKVGEMLRYVVRFSIWELGEVKLVVKDKKIVNGKPVYKTFAYIDSYRGVPFVDLHQIYESDVNSSFFSNYFKGLVKGDDYTSYTEYFFNYDQEQIRVKKGKVYPPEIWNDSTTTAKIQYQDGLSIFYFARMKFDTKRTVVLPCFVNEEKVSTTINFYDEEDEVEIDAVDYGISALRLDGHTDFISIFGLTGDFEGWFSNDEAAIPLIAKMNVIIGSITLELIEWKREGWNPPAYQE